MAKKNEALQEGLARLAAGLDHQWRIVVLENQTEDGPFLAGYNGMTHALVVMGGEWRRNEKGRHWVYLAGQSAKAEGVE